MAEDSSLTGDDVRSMRLALGLATQQLRELLGVGPATVARWERTRGSEIETDPRNRELLDLLRGLVAKRTPEQTRALGRRIRIAIANRGGLYALHRVLAIAHIDEHDHAPSASEAS
jgi:transcriptional regulator with XRE-family HTH domain